MKRGPADFPRAEGTRQRGFSISDLLFSIGIVAVLSTLILGAFNRSRSASTSARCLSNLHCLGIAFSQYAADNNMRYPMPALAGRSWESLLQRYTYQPMVFACPADDEIFPSVGSSYDWRDTAASSSTLAGKPMFRIGRSNAVMAFETLPGWHGKGRMHAVLVNGSAISLGDEECLGDLTLSVDSLDGTMK